MNTSTTGTTTYSAGIDLHKNPLQLHVRDAAGTTVCQQTIKHDKRRQLLAALAIYHMWKRREPFDVKKFLGTAYAPRAQSSH